MTNAPAPEATVIVPANNEAAFIGPCLEAVLRSAGEVPFETIVVANACTDATVTAARATARRIGHEDRPVRIIDTPRAGKLRALQMGDEAARAATRIYLDADVTVSPGLIPALIEALGADGPRYAGGLPEIAPAANPATRLYARFWQRLPFFSTGVPGFGIFAVNGAGRTRWQEWPDIVSDDTFARLNFAPAERILVPHTYRWPMVEGFGGLVRVRRRQDRGVQEIARRFPDLLRNADPGARPRGQKMLAALRDPGGFAVYALVALCVRLSGRDTGVWERGR